MRTSSNLPSPPEEILITDFGGSVGQQPGARKFLDLEPEIADRAGWAAAEHLLIHNGTPLELARVSGPKPAQPTHGCKRHLAPLVAPHEVQLAIEECSQPFGLLLGGPPRPYR